MDVDQLDYVGTGKKYGVSDNAVRKWLKLYESEAGIVTGSQVAGARESKKSPIDSHIEEKRD